MIIVTKRVLGTNNHSLSSFSLPSEYGVFHAEKHLAVNYQDGQVLRFRLREVFHNVAYYKFVYATFQNDERYGLGPTAFGH